MIDNYDVNCEVFDEINVQSSEILEIFFPYQPPVSLLIKCFLNRIVLSKSKKE